MVPDRYQLGQAIGKEARVVVALLDEGFAKKLLTLLD
jgi:ribosomal protein L7Ae-like RNA K-turn-binding protein